jgi:DNA-binding transcriptional ArsR family regulator
MSLPQGLQAFFLAGVTLAIFVHPYKQRSMKTLPASFKAFADPTRLRIVNVLLRSPLCVCEIARVLGLSQPLLSRHLAYLRHCGVVEGRRDRMRVQYTLNRKHVVVERVLPLLEDILQDDVTGRADIRKLIDAGFIPKKKIRESMGTAKNPAAEEIARSKQKTIKTVVSGERDRL